MATGKLVLSVLAPFALAAVLVLPSVAQAEAQGPSGFGLHFGWIQSDTFEPGPQLMLCMADHQIREAIAQRGYKDIALNAPNDRRIQVRASLDGIVYLLEYNFCTDTIEDRQRLR